MPKTDSKKSQKARSTGSTPQVTMYTFFQPLPKRGTDGSRPEPTVSKQEKQTEESEDPGSPSTPVEVTIDLSSPEKQLPQHAPPKSSPSKSDDSMDEEFVPEVVVTPPLSQSPTDQPQEPQGGSGTHQETSDALRSPTPLELVVNLEFVTPSSTDGTDENAMETDEEPNSDKSTAATNTQESNQNEEKDQNRPESLLDPETTETKHKEERKPENVLSPLFSPMTMGFMSPPISTTPTKAETDSRIAKLFAEIDDLLGTTSDLGGDSLTSTSVGDDILDMDLTDMAPKKGGKKGKGKEKEKEKAKTIDKFFPKAPAAPVLSDFEREKAEGDRLLANILHIRKTHAEKQEEINRLEQNLEEIMAGTSPIFDENLESTSSSEDEEEEDSSKTKSADDESGEDGFGFGKKARRAIAKAKKWSNFQNYEKLMPQPQRTVNLFSNPSKQWASELQWGKDPLSKRMSATLTELGLEMESLIRERGLKSGWLQIGGRFVPKNMTTWLIELVAFGRPTQGRTRGGASERRQDTNLSKVAYEFLASHFTDFAFTFKEKHKKMEKYNYFPTFTDFWDHVFVPMGAVYPPPPPPSSSNRQPKSSTSEKEPLSSPTETAAPSGGASSSGDGLSARQSQNLKKVLELMDICQLKSPRRFFTDPSDVMKFACVLCTLLVHEPTTPHDLNTGTINHTLSNTLSTAILLHPQSRASLSAAASLVCQDLFKKLVTDLCGLNIDEFSVASDDLFSLPVLACTNELMQRHLGELVVPTQTQPNAEVASSNLSEGVSPMTTEGGNGDQEMSVEDVEKKEKEPAESVVAGNEEDAMTLPVSSQPSTATVTQQNEQTPSKGGESSGSQKAGTPAKQVSFGKSPATSSLQQSPPPFVNLFERVPWVLVHMIERFGFESDLWFFRAKLSMYMVKYVLNHQDTRVTFEDLVQTITDRHTATRNRVRKLRQESGSSADAEKQATCWLLENTHHEALWVVLWLLDVSHVMNVQYKPVRRQSAGTFGEHTELEFEIMALLAALEKMIPSSLTNPRLNEPRVAIAKMMNLLTGKCVAQWHNDRFHQTSILNFV